MSVPILLQASHVGKTVKSGDAELNILRDINLAIKPGESLAILGASGAGKSTLLSCLAGLDLPSVGKITFLDVEFTDIDEERRALYRRENIGFVFQSFQLIESLTALENVMLPLELQGKPADKEAKLWLEKIGLAQRAHHYPNQLSGGEQQRVAIARAFVTGPKILFADEPTGNLDHVTSKTVEDLLFHLNQLNNTALVIVTHNERLAARCGHTVNLIDGTIVC